MYPIHIGEAHDFAVVRELLVRANFTEPAVAARLGVPMLTQPAIDGSGESPENPVDALHLLIGLFVRNSFVDEQSIGEHLSGAEIEALHRLGLIARGQDNASWYSPVSLCPVGGIYTVSDRWKGPDGKPLEGSEDIVYPAVVPNTRLFLDLLPDSRCESFLDLCSGTGVAALIAASKYAAEAHAYDIAMRSTHFAEFARLLNGLTNVTTGTGDLYEPAAGATFDRIVAHPPYVPVLESKWIFFDGGDDGERVTRRIIEQAPRFLRPGGTLYCLAMASDRADRPLEVRIREWLGSEQREFDVAVVVRRMMEPQEFAFNSLTRGEAGAAPARKWKELFEARRITFLPYAMMMVQRKAAGRAPSDRQKNIARRARLAARLGDLCGIASRGRARCAPKHITELRAPHFEPPECPRLGSARVQPRDRLSLPHGDEDRFLDRLSSRPLRWNKDRLSALQ